MGHVANGLPIYRINERRSGGFELCVYWLQMPYVALATIAS